MKRNTKYKISFLLILPFFVGIIINLLFSIAYNQEWVKFFSAITMLLRFWGFAVIIYWFHVGKYFKNLEIPKLKSFILGNSVWIVSLLLFLWQFILLNDSSRNLFIAGISQDYILGFVNISSIIIGVFTGNIHSDMVTMVAYLIMLLVFTIGFVYTPKKTMDKEVV